MRSLPFAASCRTATRGPRTDQVQVAASTATGDRHRHASVPRLSQPVGLCQVASWVRHDRDLGGTGSDGAGDHHNHVGLAVENSVGEGVT